MAPKKDRTILPSRARLPRAAKDEPKKSPELIPKTTPKTIRKSPSRPKKAASSKISTSKAGSADGVKGKAKEAEIATPAVPSAALNNETIRQEAIYPNPFSTDSSRRSTAAWLSQWDSTKSPGLLFPESERGLVNGTPKSKSPSPAKSDHEQACSTSNKRHVAIPSPSAKDRGEKTSQIFDANKQHRLDSLTEGRFPDPTYPRASISGGTEPSSGFSAAMGFRYSPGFGGPHGFNPSPRSQFGLDVRRKSSAMFGTGDPSSSEQTKPTDPIDPSADAVLSSRIDGVDAGPSSSKNLSTIPDPLFSEYLRNISTDWDNYYRVTGQDYGGYLGYQGYQPFHRPFGPHGSLFGPGNPQYYNHEMQNSLNHSSWTAPQLPGVSSTLELPLIPNFSSTPQGIEYQGSSQPEQTAQTSAVENTSVAENLEPLGIKESRMTREKTMFVPGGKVIKTTTTVFTPTDEEKGKGRDTETPEDKVGIVIVDKEGNVDVESGDWLAGFNRIEGWEVEALLHRSKRWWPPKDRNGVNKKGVAKKPILKKATPLKKAAAPSRNPTSPKSQAISTTSTTLTSTDITPNSPKLGSTQNPQSPRVNSNLDFIPFDFPDDGNLRSTRSRATRISKPISQPLKRGTASRANPVKKAIISPPKKAPKATPSKTKAATHKTVKFSSAPAVSLQVTSPPPVENSSADSRSLIIADKSERATDAPTSIKPKNSKSKALAKSSTPKSTPAKMPAKETKKTSPSKSKPAASTSKPKAQPQSDIHKAKKTRRNVPKPGTTHPFEDFASSISDLETQVQRQLHLADQASKNMERRRGKDAEQAAKDFEALVGFVEKGRKELDKRRNSLDS
ncbi:hypothetical protein DSL72_004624 [Monilinia vaccinii-corymbosi]|uniref:Uncharacterized protein n=1 Tax=Monilinia vaccinii-corymbosi TaxID=61207 RepID=A0A8A3P2P4_9HELO|nr:hypothetical protein DSL72_004624 [Monilinia vaccinii-corymbosi]